MIRINTLLALAIIVFVQQAEAVDRIAFGSCSHQDDPLEILDAVVKEKPDVFVFLGDNIYGDTTDMNVLKNKYQKLGENPRFRNLQAQTDVIAIWDDHDYGENDAGREYPQKQASRQIMLDFWNEPDNSTRRSRQDGIYTSYTYGEAEQRVQIILPDLRWNRPDIKRVSKLEEFTSRKPNSMGPYSPQQNISMLGETQWQWLERELLKPAKIKVIASSLQLAADFTGWEAWANFPADRTRLFNFIRDNKINGVVIISGDTHWGEMSVYQEELDYPLWEVTSSGLSHEWKAVSPNKHRVGNYYDKINYGVLNIDWTVEDPRLQFGLKDKNGYDVMMQIVSLSAISPYSEGH